MIQEQLCQDQPRITLDDKSHLRLNYETINTYMSLIMRSYPDTVYAFRTFFYESLPKEGYSKTISQLTKKVDIFSKKKIFVPVYNSAVNHWCLIYVDFDEKTIEYYDSLGVPNFYCSKLILKYLFFEHFDKKKKKFNAIGWSLKNMSKCPKQENFYDSGLFVCMFAEHLSRDAPLKFTQKHMYSFRKQMQYEIMVNNLTQ